MTKIIGLIPARGGSKGIPGKNIRNLAGKPLIAWTIEAVLRCKACNRVIVSTDSPEIAHIAHDWGAEVPFTRPENLSDDNSDSIGLAIHSINYLLENGIKKSDYLLLLQPTSPLRIELDILNAIEIMKTKNASAIVSVTEAPSHPYKVKKISSEGIISDFNNLHFDNIRRQDLPPAYAINGAIYLNQISSILEEKSFMPINKTYAYIMPPERSIDIDTPWDFYLSELIIRDNIIHNSKNVCLSQE